MLGAHRHSCGDFFIDNYIYLHALLGFTLEQSIQPPFFVVCGRSTKVQLGCKPPVLEFRISMTPAWASKPGGVREWKWHPWRYLASLRQRTYNHVHPRAYVVGKWMISSKVNNYVYHFTKFWDLRAAKLLKRWLLLISVRIWSFSFSSGSLWRPIPEDEKLEHNQSNNTHGLDS